MKFGETKYFANYQVEDQDPYMPLSTIDRGGRGGSMGAPVYQRYQLIFAVIINHPDLVLVAGQETSTPLRRHHPTTGP